MNTKSAQLIITATTPVNDFNLYFLEHYDLARSLGSLSNHYYSAHEHVQRLFEAYLSLSEEQRARVEISPFGSNLNVTGPLEWIDKCISEYILVAYEKEEY